MRRVLIALAGLGLVTACSPAEPELSFADGVVRESDGSAQMTAIFGTLTNDGAEPIVITGFTTSLKAPVNEIHQTQNGQMSKLDGGITIEPGESVTLEPGGIHFMVMDYPEPIHAGDSVKVTAVLQDGTEIPLDDASVRAIGAGDESYADIHHHHH